jgi:hypothetical protein
MVRIEYLPRLKSRRPSTVARGRGGRLPPAPYIEVMKLRYHLVYVVVVAVLQAVDVNQLASIVPKAWQ